MEVAAIRYAQVHGLRMAYREIGRGDPIVFLHGNPTSSYLWRDVLGRVAHRGRCLAPDLVGIGSSDKLPGSGPGSYRFVDHRDHLDALLDALGVHDRVVLVGHDWGGVLAVDWARRHPDAVRGIAYLETLVAPVSWAGPNAPDPALFGALRGPDGERLVLVENVFVERGAPGGDGAQPDRRGDGCLPRSVSRTGGVAAADADVAARDPDTASRPMSTRSSRGTRSGWCRRRCRSCSSTAIPVCC